MMHIQILGAGCANCERLAQNAEVAAKELGIDFTLEKINDIARILEYNIFLTPGLVVDGRVLHSGSVLSVEKVKKILLESDGK